MHPDVLLFPSSPPTSFSRVQFGLEPLSQSQLCSLLQGAQPRSPAQQSLDAELIQRGCLLRQITGERPPMQNQEPLGGIIPANNSNPPRIYQIVKLAALTQAAILGGQLSLQSGFHQHSSLPQPAKPAPKRHSRQAGRHTTTHAPASPGAPAGAGKSRSSDSERDSVDKG